MQNPYSDNLETDLNGHSDPNDLLSLLEIQVDKDFNIRYNISYASEEEGLQAIAQMFFELSFNHLTDQIYDEIQQQCVLNNKENELSKITSYIQQLLKNATIEQSAQSDDDDVIPPDQSF